MRRPCTGENARACIETPKRGLALAAQLIEDAEQVFFDRGLAEVELVGDIARYSTLIASKPAVTKSGNLKIRCAPVILPPISTSPPPSRLLLILEI